MVVSSNASKVAGVTVIAMMQGFAIDHLAAAQGTEWRRLEHSDRRQSRF
jgi:hypothetical protein